MRLIIAVLFLGLASPAIADEIKFARAICTAMDRTGHFSQPCDINGWDRSVNLWLDGSAAEARIYCQQIVSMVGEGGLKFGRDWQLKIFSPYSGENTIAYCQLTPD